MGIYNSDTLPDTIPISTALGGGVSINNLDVIGLYMPPAWDTASVTVSVSLDGVTWANAYDTSGNELNWTVAANRYVAIPPATLAGIAYLRIRSGTSGTPVNQTAARTVNWITRNYGR